MATATQAPVIPPRRICNGGGSSLTPGQKRTAAGQFEPRGATGARGSPHAAFAPAMSVMGITKHANKARGRMPDAAIRTLQRLRRCAGSADGRLKAEAALGMGSMSTCRARHWCGHLKIGGHCAGTLQRSPALPCTVLSPITNQRSGGTHAALARLHPWHSASNCFS